MTNDTEYLYMYIGYLIKIFCEVSVELKFFFFFCHHFF